MDHQGIGLAMSPTSSAVDFGGGASIPTCRWMARKVGDQQVGPLGFNGSRCNKNIRKMQVTSQLYLYALHVDDYCTMNLPVTEDVRMIW